MALHIETADLGLSKRNVLEWLGGPIHVRQVPIDAPDLPVEASPDPGGFPYTQWRNAELPALERQGALRQTDHGAR
jgi:hypothetical protein